MLSFAGKVTQTKMKQTNTKHVQSAIPGFVGSMLGALMFVIAINVIIVPHQLYSGTLTGVAQVIEALLVTHTPISMPTGFNLTGTALLLLNIPLMIMVFRVTNSSLPVKSIINIVFMTVAMSFVPIPDIPVVTDPLAAAIVGGAFAGFGAGFTLRCGGSGGGSDLIGLYCSVKYPNFTVGRVTLFISMFVYGYGLLNYELDTVIYSALFTVIYSFTLDHIHYQNIKTSAFVFTTNKDTVKSVVEQFGRGATCWEGRGAFSGNHMYVFVAVVSKYETARLKRIVSAADPSSFIVFNNKVDVSGNFIKRF